MMFKTHVLSSKWLKFFAFVGLLTESPLIIENANLIVSAGKKIPLSKFNINAIDLSDLITNENINSRKSETIDEESDENANFDDFATNELATVGSAMTIIQDLLHKLNHSNMCEGHSTIKNDKMQSLNDVLDEFEKAVYGVVKSNPNKNFKIQTKKFYNEYVYHLRQANYLRKFKNRLFSLKKKYQNILSSVVRFCYTGNQRYEILQQLTRLSALIDYLLIRQNSNEIIWTDNDKDRSIEQRIDAVLKTRSIDTKSHYLSNGNVDIIGERALIVPQSLQSERINLIIESLKRLFGSNAESSNTIMVESNFDLPVDGWLPNQIQNEQQSSADQAEINTQWIPRGLNVNQLMEYLQYRMQRKKVIQGMNYATSEVELSGLHEVPLHYSPENRSSEDNSVESEKSTSSLESPGVSSTTLTQNRRNLHSRTQSVTHSTQFSTGVKGLFKKYLRNLMKPKLNDETLKADAISLFNSFYVPFPQLTETFDNIISNEFQSFDPKQSLDLQNSREKANLQQIICYLRQINFPDSDYNIQSPKENDAVSFKSLTYSPDQPSSSSDESKKNAFPVVALERSVSVASDKTKSSTNSHKCEIIHQQQLQTQRQKAERQKHQKGQRELSNNPPITSAISQSHTNLQHDQLLNQYQNDNQQIRSNNPLIIQRKLKYTLLRNSLESVIIKPESEILERCNSIYLTHYTNFDRHKQRFSPNDQNLIEYFEKYLNLYNKRLYGIGSNHRRYTKSESIRASAKRIKLMSIHHYMKIRSRIDVMIFKSSTRTEFEENLNRFINLYKAIAFDAKLRLQLMSDLKLSYHQIFGRFRYSDEIIQRKDKIIKILQHLEV